MKTFKTSILIALLLCFSFNLSHAQKRFMVHQDNVKPSMLMQYEAIAKKFNDACVKHNPQTSWATGTRSDFKYFYITPIENFADMDKNPFADMAKTMGDEFGKMFEEFDKCYDSHTNYTITMVEDLTYMPEGISMTQEGQNYRKWYYIYFTPSNAKKVREGMKAVKALYESKNSKEYYRVYRSGFGTPEEFYLVAISAKDAIDFETKSKTNEATLGTKEEVWEVFSKVMEHATRMEEFSGEMRPDLAYAPK